MWVALRPSLVSVHPVRIEAHAAPGVPDVNTAAGWIELKYADRWPPRGGPLRVPHFTPAQRAWLKKRVKAGGSAWLMLKVGRREWLLFRGDLAADILGDCTRDELQKLATGVWDGPPGPYLAELLRR